jgi:lipoprotein-anchoring transpeptidase ErfK/SrfK
MLCQQRKHRANTCFECNPMNALFSNKRTRFFVIVWGILLVISAGFAIFFFATSPANASILGVLAPSPTPRQENSWAFADVPKPTYTPVPVIPTIIPTEQAQVAQVVPAATEIPGSMVMEVVNDVPSSANMAPVGARNSSYGGSKYILVSISEQHMYVYEGDVLIYSFVASTGIHNATRVGNFAVQSKIPNAYGSTWNIWMPDWLGIYWAGSTENGIHALPILPNGATLWAGFLGSPVSYGCVVLGTYDAQVLYDWAEMGTPVDIQW